MKNTSKSTKDLVLLSLFGAIIIALASIPFLGYIPLGFTRATTIHIPVIIASLLLGPKKGALLGAIFGLTSLFNNTFNPTPTSFVFSPFYTFGDNSGNFFSLIICMVPRILVGVVPFYTYKILLNFKKVSIKASLFVAGLFGSLTNTLLVMNLIYIFFGESYGAVKETAPNLVYTLILSIIGINGVPEAIVAAILTTVIASTLIKLKTEENL